MDTHYTCGIAISRVVAVSKISENLIRIFVGMCMNVFSLYRIAGPIMILIILELTIHYPVEVKFRAAIKRHIVVAEKVCFFSHIEIGAAVNGIRLCGSASALRLEHCHIGNLIFVFGGIDVGVESVYGLRGS